MLMWNNLLRYTKIQEMTSLWVKIFCETTHEEVRARYSKWGWLCNGFGVSLSQASVTWLLYKHVQAYINCFTCHDLYERVGSSIGRASWGKHWIVSNDLYVNLVQNIPHSDPLTNSHLSPIYLIQCNQNRGNYKMTIKEFKKINRLCHNLIPHDKLAWEDWKGMPPF